MFKVCETASSEAQALLSQIKEDLKLLNQITSKMSRESLTREGLHSEYILGAIGDPHIGSGFKPIFSSSTPDQDRVRALSRDIDYNHYRNKLKVQKCSIPMIWDRFPPQNFEEREQMREDLQKWEAQKASQRLKEDRKPTFQKTPLDLHFEREAKRESKRTQIPIAKLLASPDFRERQKSIFDLLQSMLPEGLLKFAYKLQKSLKRNLQMPQLTQTVKFTVSDEDGNITLTVPLTFVLYYDPGKKPFLFYRASMDYYKYRPGPAVKLELVRVFSDPDMRYEAPSHFKEWALNWIEQNKENFCEAIERK